ncbi:MAG: hypothetical protein ACJ747_14950 [Gaiellaceae bacterium]
MKVAIGFAESLAAPEAAWSLRDAGHQVVAFTRDGAKPPVRKCRDVELVRVPRPEDDAERTVGALAEALRRSGADCVLPLDDEAVWVGARLAERHAVRFVGPTGKHEGLALDKRTQLGAAEAAGFRVPAARAFRTADELRAAAAEVEFPAVVRAARAVDLVDGRLAHPRVAVAADTSELEHALSSFPPGTPLLVQRWIAGTSEGFFGLAGGARVHAPSAHQRIRMTHPHGSHSSACRARAVDPAVAEAAGRMVAAAAWRGLFMIELLRDRDGVPWFVELNGRPWGSIALSRRMGFEYPAWAVAQSIDPAFDVPTPAPRSPVLCRHLGSELLHLLIVLRGKRSRAATTWPSRGRTAADVLHFSRSDRWYNLRAGERSVFVDDTFHYVAGTMLAKVR